MGSFGNASVLARTLKRLSPDVVTLLAMGTEGVRKAVEDELCAVYLKALLDGREQDITSFRDEIMEGEGARRLRRLGQDKDFPLCLRPDIFDLVPEVNRRRDGMQVRALE